MAFDRSKLARLAKDLAERATELAPAPAVGPVARQIVPDEFMPEGLCTTEREWLCDQVRFLARIYGLDWFVRQETRGYAGLESMPDDELQGVYKRVSKAIECIKDGVSFEDAGLISYEGEQ